MVYAQLYFFFQFLFFWCLQLLKFISISQEQTISAFQISGIPIDIKLCVDSCIKMIMSLYGSLNKVLYELNYLKRKYSEESWNNTVFQSCNHYTFIYLVVSKSVDSLRKSFDIVHSLIN